MVTEGGGEHKSQCRRIVRCNRPIIGHVIDAFYASNTCTKYAVCTYPNCESPWCIYLMHACYMMTSVTHRLIWYLFNEHLSFLKDPQIQNSVVYNAIPYFIFCSILMYSVLTNTQAKKDLFWLAPDNRPLWRHLACMLGTFPTNIGANHNRNF